MQDRVRITIPTPPHADQRPARSTWHGTTLVDDYAWLRADNWQEVMRDPAQLGPEIRDYLEAENAYTDAMMSDTKALQAQLFAEMKARIKEDDNSVPTPDGAWDYFSSYVTGGQYPRVCRRPRGGGNEAILIDGNAEAAGKPYWQIGGSSQSPDHRLLAYAVDDKGSELYTIRFRDMTTGHDLDDAIPDTRGGFAWANDSRTLFYVRLDDNHRPIWVYRHEVGTPAASDVLVYTEPDIGFYVGVGKTQSNKFILIDAHDHQTNECYLIDADDPAGALRLVAPRLFGHEYSVEHHYAQDSHPAGEAGFGPSGPGSAPDARRAGEAGFGPSGPDDGRLIITTNSGGAEDFRICEAPVAAPAQGNWREILQHKPGRLILEAGVLARHLVRLERENGLPRIVVHRFADGAEHAIAFDEEAYGLGMSTGYEYDTATIRFTYSSMTTPAEVYDYDVETRQRTLRKRQEVPSGHTVGDYVTRRVFAPAGDGETVPVSLLYRRDTPLDGSAPLFLYGYGSYGISIPASFSTTRLSLVDRGFIFAIAHIRGGKDKGYRWYTGGKHKTKLNTFTDFIAAGEYLAANGYTRRGRIVANGGSAGGMLMGAVANMAPDLFLGIIADVPFVDVLNTMLDKDLPLTPPEWPEWGNPIVSPDDFEIIRSYSPYDQVAAKAYPHIFAYGGLTDPRVTYWEPAKWVARLREKKTDHNLLLLQINMSAGHGGASGRFEQLKEIALDFAFALKVAGKTGGIV